MSEQLQFQKQPWKHDVRSNRFSHERFFGSAAILPTTLGRDAGPVLDQGHTLRCTGYGNAAEGFFIHGIPMNPDWSAAKIGLKQGASVDERGGDPNACMKSMRDDGFLPMTAAPRTLQTSGVEGTGIHSWSWHLDDVARKYDVGIGFFKVDGPYDVFDNIRSAIYQNYNSATKRGNGVDAFGRWYHPWTNPPDGIIPSNYDAENDFAGYHRYVFFDWCVINGNYYLKAKNSYGARGDNGVYYFPREVVNREFSQWGTTLKILKTATPEQLAEAKKLTPFGRLWDAVFQAFYNFSERYGLFGL